MVVPSATIALAGAPADVRVARCFTARSADLVLRDRPPLATQEVQDLELLVSELVSNAIEHGIGPIDLTLIGRPDCLRVEIVDHEDAVPVRRYSVPDALNGRGLAIVAALSRDWGWRPLLDGKKVWFDYPTG
jgi:anti-sigma regulatory factor (Ser/Thr protein kinase)